MVTLLMESDTKNLLVFVGLGLILEVYLELWYGECALDKRDTHTGKKKFLRSAILASSWLHRTIFKHDIYTRL